MFLCMGEYKVSRRRFSNGQSWDDARQNLASVNDDWGYRIGLASESKLAGAAGDLDNNLLWDSNNIHRVASSRNIEQPPALNACLVNSAFSCRESNVCAT